MKQSIGDNLVISKIEKLAGRLGILNRKKMEAEKTDIMKRMKIKSPSPDYAVSTLSGGNQQKVVLAKWLAEKSRILILDEPTRGIDVNAKAEIYKLICEYIREGGSVVMVSSELPEVVGISQRIVVMHAGRITAVVEGERMTEETIMYYATLDEDTARGDIIE